MPRNRRRKLRAVAVRAVAAAALAVVASCASPEPSEPPSGPRLRIRGDRVADFTLDAVYTDASGGRLGSRWVHVGHGMPVTVLHIQSVPQVFLAFHTPPVSDRGEPHTGEHLLLGKGTKGKTLSVEQEMSLVESTAWTSQTDVCYSWSCSAGKETFYRSVEQNLDALLLPDYSDEEIRREVCHVGPVKDEATGALSVDEKGTVYQEMVSSYEKAWIAWDPLAKQLWGEGHPLAMSSGGEPSAVRTCTPEHVRAFHQAHYHLGPGTRLIASLPDSVPEEDFLARLSSQLAAVDAQPGMRGRTREQQPIPPARPAPHGPPIVVPYPNPNEEDGGVALFAWKPVPLGSQSDRVRAELFLSTLGNGDAATLYKRLMDRATREVAVDAASMSAGADASKADLLPNVWFEGFPPRNATPDRLADICSVLRDEVLRVSRAPAGSPAIVEFNRKALVQLTEREKGLRRSIDSPPLFGHRGSGGFWIDHLRLLDQGGGFERSVTLAPVFGKLRAELLAGENPWAKVVADLGLAEEPHVAVSVPSRAEAERRAAEKARRIEGHVAAIARERGGDAQQALAKFAADYERKTAELDLAEKSLPKPRLVADVPLTPDPSIRMERAEAGGVAGHRATFEHMSFAEASIAFRVDPPEGTLPWLAVLPRLLVDSGVVEDGKPVAYDEAAERRSQEIHALTADWAMRPSRGRRELRVTASGADAKEAVRAVDWIERCVGRAWIATENLPRLRDLVAEEFRSTRARLGGAEESWVREAAAAVRWQRDRTFLATSSLHARLFLLARCEWRLMEPPGKDDAEAVERRFAEIEALARFGASRPGAAEALGKLIAEWKTSESRTDPKWAIPIAERMRELAGDMSTKTESLDLAALVATARADLALPVSDALAQIEALRIATVRGGGRARFVVTGNRAGTDALLARLGPFLLGLGASGPAPAPPVAPIEADAADLGVVDTRLADHEGGGGPAPREVTLLPTHYGLVQGASATGVFVLTSSAGGYEDLARENLQTDLAARVFGGSGAHAFFMKTWGAGIAYSNGLSVTPSEARLQYYAERCPDLAETMKFVRGLVDGAGALDDPWLAEYCVAGAVAWSRESDEFESRARAAADDLADGDTPQRIEKWRRAVLDLRRDPALWKALAPKVEPSVGRVIPGVQGVWRRSRTVSVTIAPEPMLVRWEAFLAGCDPSRAEKSYGIHRVYGRDFWIVE